MLPWKFQQLQYIYSNFWRINLGIYNYKVLFFEKEGHPYSCKNKFPLTLSDNSIVTKDEFAEIVKEAFKSFNSLNLGITFNYIGQEITDREHIAFDTKDNINAITYFWNYKYGGLAGPMSKYEFGIKADLINRGRREWYIGVIRHELLHCLGFGHKDDNIKSLKTSPVINGLHNKGEFSEDSIHGLKTIYNIPTKYEVSGRVVDFNLYSYDYIEAFIVNWKNKELCYQSPVDSLGDFEFRLDKPIKQFKLFILGKEKNKYYRFNRINKPRKMNIFNKKFTTFPSMENSARTLEEIKEITGINI